MEVLEKAPPTRKVVSKEDIFQMISAAERLSDEVARERQVQFRIVSIFGTTATLIFVINLFVYLFYSPILQFGFWGWIPLGFGFSLFGLAGLGSFRQLRRSSERRRIFSKSLSSIMLLIDESMGFFRDELSPLDREVIRIRLSTVTLS